MTVLYREFGETKQAEAEFLGLSLPTAILSKIPVKPNWPEAKAFAIQIIEIGRKSRLS